MTYAEIKKTLSVLTDPSDKLEMVMELGKSLEPVPEDAKCTEILGCASFVKICEKNGEFYGVADSMMVRGIVAIFLAMVNGKNIEEIRQFDLSGEFNSLNLQFGASRLNGIQSMIRFFHNL